MVAETRAGHAIPAMVAATAKNTELAAAYRSFIGDRRRISAVPLARAARRGELALEADPQLVLDLLVAPLFYRAFVSREPLDDRYVDALVDAVLRAFA